MSIVRFAHNSRWPLLLSPGNVVSTTAGSVVARAVRASSSRAVLQRTIEDGPAHVQYHRYVMSDVKLRLLTYCNGYAGPLLKLKVVAGQVGIGTHDLRATAVWSRAHRSEVASGFHPNTGDAGRATADDPGCRRRLKSTLDQFPVSRSQHRVTRKFLAAWSARGSLAAVSDS
jgi:hypothetical protein